MTVLIDSWTWIEYWKGGKLAKVAAAYIEGDEESVVSTVNISEVYFWIASSHRPHHNASRAGWVSIWQDH